MLARSYRVWNKNEKKDVCRYRMWMGLFFSLYFIRLAWGQSAAQPHRLRSPNAILANLSNPLENCGHSRSKWMRASKNRVSHKPTKDLLPWRGNCKSDGMAQIELHMWKMSDSTLKLISDATVTKFERYAVYNTARSLCRNNPTNWKQ